jgi:hypothetical protein
MSYGQNSPFGLKPIGHLMGGASNISLARGKYVIDTIVGTTLNKGDPVVIQGSIASSAVGNYFKGGETVITRYSPTVTLGAANNRTGITTNSPIVGVFMGCKFKDASGTFVEQEYWATGTAATSKVEAIIYDDPDIIWELQLSTYLGSDAANAGRFLVLPSMQLQDATWPNTGNAAANPTVANSAIIGANIMLLTGRGPAAGNAGGSGSLTTVTKWDGTAAVLAGYADNPLVTNYGTNNVARNPWGVSTFYGCPSIAGTTGNPSVADGRNEYDRVATMPFKVLGFSDDPKNIPDSFGQPSNAGTVGTYFNTPFLRVTGVINNHVFRAGSVSVTPAA